MRSGDTIAAISTPLGEGAIGIVRMSGKDAFEIAARVFKDPSCSRARKLRAWGVRYGAVVDSETGEHIDEVLAIAMPAPSSFTREDVVEFSCHGGIGPLSRVLEALLKCGARLAEPGEFTMRAFLAGRIDLSQAEAVIDLVRARTDSARRLALANLRGGLSSRVNAVREEVLKLLAQIEAAMDFPEDDIEPVEQDEIARASRGAAGRLRELAGLAKRGRVYRDGVIAAIVGRPNVGKSSLLNAMIGRKRAIVTDIPGTTRDAIGEWTSVGGVPMMLVDTAGMRDTKDPVERLGVEAACEEMDRADLVVAVLDASCPMTREDATVLEQVPRREGIVALNKCDLAPMLRKRDVIPLVEGKQVLSVSAKTGSGIEDLGCALAKLAMAGTGEGPVMANLRQLEAVEKALACLEDAAGAVEQAGQPDLAAIDLREALFWLDQVTGRSVSDDLLESIFSEFCIGK